MPKYHRSVLCLCAHVLSCVCLFAALWAVDRQAPLSMEFFQLEYCSGLPFPTPGDLPDPGIESVSSLFCTSCTGRWILYHWGSLYVINKYIRIPRCNGEPTRSIPEADCRAQLFHRHQGGLRRGWRCSVSWPPWLPSDDLLLCRKLLCRKSPPNNGLKTVTGTWLTNLGLTENS